MGPVSTEDRKEMHPPFCLHPVADLECTVLTSKGVDRNRKGLFDTLPMQRVLPGEALENLTVR